MRSVRPTSCVVIAKLVNKRMNSYTKRLTLTSTVALSHSRLDQLVPQFKGNSGRHSQSDTEPADASSEEVLLMRCNSAWQPATTTRLTP